MLCPSSSLTDGCSRAGSFPCPAWHCHDPWQWRGQCQPFPRQACPQEALAASGVVPSPAWLCCCHPAGLPEGCAGTAVLSYRSPQLQGCGQDATRETRPCPGVACYLHGRYEFGLGISPAPSAPPAHLKSQPTTPGARPDHPGHHGAATWLSSPPCCPAPPGQAVQPGPAHNGTRGTGDG